MRRERMGENFRRAVTLPTGVQADKVEAHVAHGVLIINLPKIEEAKPRTIKVKVKQ